MFATPFGPAFVTAFEGAYIWHPSGNLSCVADEDVHTHGPIEPDKSVDEIRQEPYSLPPGFSWDSLDIDNPAVVNTPLSNWT